MCIFSKKMLGLLYAILNVSDVSVKKIKHYV